ncbi:MAG: hypothetical protein NPIRA02_36920 [Nitrospirales bacterium]|nr:MAG: hypothetical protein NPIRA02_36920 [Nitrospirales bacterium]
MQKNTDAYRGYGGDTGLWRTDSIQAVLRVGVATGVFILGASWAQVEAQDLRRQGMSGSQVYNYVSEGRRDPFRSIVQPTSVPQVQETAVQPSPLPIVDWTLLGVISGRTGHHAMLQHANGSRYLVSLGDILHGGHIRVAGLTPAGVTLELLEQNGNGFSNGEPQSQIMELTFQGGT